MKANYLIAVIILIGCGVLFFFPEPETNFLAYAGTALLFVGLVVVIKIWEKRRK